METATFQTECCDTRTRTRLFAPGASGRGHDHGGRVHSRSAIFPERGIGRGSARQFQLPEQLELKLYTAQSEIVNERQGAIRFFPDGSSTGGRVTLASGERKFLVDVDWLTGKVSIRSGR